jgi:hypothetical protein
VYAGDLVNSSAFFHRKFIQTANQTLVGMHPELGRVSMFSFLFPQTARMNWSSLVSHFYILRVERI